MDIIVYNRSHAKDSVCPHKVDVALIQSMCQSGRCCYLTHIEIRMTWTYATEVTVIEEIYYCIYYCVLRRTDADMPKIASSVTSDSTVEDVLVHVFVVLCLIQE